MPKGYGKGPRKFEDLINQHPMDDKFVKSMEEDIKNDPNRKDELDFYKAIKGSDVFNCESGKVYNFIMKNGEKIRAFGKPMSDKRGKHTNVDMYSLWKCNGMNFGIIYDPWGGYAGAVGKRSDLKKIWDEASKTDKDWYDSLGSIKEHLFDAPNDVKAAFNTIVGWFDDKLPEKLSLSGIYHEWKGPMGLERQSASELSGYFKGIQDDTYKEYKDKSKNAIYSRFKTAVEFFKKSEGSQTGALADTLVGLVKAYNEK